MKRRITVVFDIETTFSFPEQSKRIHQMIDGMFFSTKIINIKNDPLSHTIHTKDGDKELTKSEYEEYVKNFPLNDPRD